MDKGDAIGMKLTPDRKGFSIIRRAAKDAAAAAEAEAAAAAGAEQA